MQTAWCFKEMWCFSFWFLYETIMFYCVLPLQAVKSHHITLRGLCRAGASSWSSRVFVPPSWLWSTAWWCCWSAHTACTAPNPAASWFTWILLSLCWLLLHWLPQLCHRSEFNLLIMRIKKTFMYVATFAVVSVVSPVNLFRCTSTDCCCCSPHLHTFVCLILDAGLQASLGCRLCTTFTSGS